MKSILLLLLFFYGSISYSQSYKWNPTTIKNNHVKRAICFSSLYSNYGANINKDFILLEYEFDKNGDLIKEVFHNSNFNEINGLDSEYLYFYNTNREIEYKIERVYYKNFVKEDTTHFLYWNNQSIQSNSHFDSSKFKTLTIKLINGKDDFASEIFLKDGFEGNTYFKEYKRNFNDDSTFTINENIYNCSACSEKYNQLSDFSMFKILIKEMFDSQYKISSKKFIENFYLYNKEKNIVKQTIHNIENEDIKIEVVYLLNEHGLVTKSSEFFIRNSSGDKLFKDGYVFEYFFW